MYFDSNGFVTHPSSIFSNYGTSVLTKCIPSMVKKYTLKCTLEKIKAKMSISREVEFSTVRSGRREDATLQSGQEQQPAAMSGDENQSFTDTAYLSRLISKAGDPRIKGSETRGEQYMTKNDVLFAA